MVSSFKKVRIPKRSETFFETLHVSQNRTGRKTVSTLRYSIIIHTKQKEQKLRNATIDE